MNGFDEDARRQQDEADLKELEAKLKEFDSPDDRAKADALRDMKDEGLDLDDLLEDIDREDEIDRFFDGVQTGYIASYFVENAENGERQVGIVKTLADSYPEAVGKMYLEVIGEYPTDEGWTPPLLTVDETTFLVIPGVPSPVMIEQPDQDDDPEPGAIDPVDGSCGDCGNPQGPCPDINQCKHFDEVE